MTTGRMATVVACMGVSALLTWLIGVGDMGVSVLMAGLTALVLTSPRWKR